MSTVVQNKFAAAAAQAVADALSFPVDKLVVTAPPKPEMGDLAVGCFPAAKELRAAPPQLAQRVAEGFAATALLASATAAGPFVNFRINRAAAFDDVVATTARGESLVPREMGDGKTVCIDYSSPNISKHLAYHHIRSTVIGHALAKLYAAVGYRVVGINHLGDWGTTHGMIIAAYKKWGADEPLDIGAINDLYVRFRAAMKDDPSLEEQGRAWFKKLEDGDQEARALWTRFREVSLREFQDVYDLLGIEFTEIRGESEYESAMPGVLAMLEEKGLSTVSQGALVVDLEADGMPPLLLKKQDGATLYATRDLAAARYRWDTYHFDRSLYVVDRGQSLHFKQLFRVLEMAGHEWAGRCMHVPFGLVRIGGKKTGTRAGNVVLLKEVLAEATERSSARIRESNPEVGDEALSTMAKTVGIGAIVFANLASQREKDVDFEWDAVLSTSGDSGPYIQYAHARTASLLRKAEELDATPPANAANLSLLTHDVEWAVAKKLLEFGEAVQRAADSNEPHIVCRYLLDLCADFSHWFTSGNHDKDLRILCEDAPTRAARLSLVSATRAVLREGLGLLGLEAPDQM